jgi:hypothetical protein
MKTLTQKRRHKTHKNKMRGVLNEKMKGEVIHDHLIGGVDRQLIGEGDALLWQARGDMKGETETEILAAHDQALQTKYYVTKTLQT